MCASVLILSLPCALCVLCGEVSVRLCRSGDKFQFEFE